MIVCHTGSASDHTSTKRIEGVFMKLSSHRLIIFAALAFALSGGSAFAQSTRTWVSGVGDDVNPCSRTAPCKTFAGAISKTAICGEIDAHEPAGDGSVTITKSITIDGGGVHASVLYSGTSGIVVNLTTPDSCQGTVILRNLSFNGINTGINGIRLVGTMVTNLHIEHVDIARNTQRGIDISPSVTGDKVYLHDVDIRNNTGDGIGVSPGATNKVFFSADHVRSRQNGGAGLHFANDAVGTISDSEFQRNANGVQLDASSVHVGLVDCRLSENSSNGLQVSGGVSTFIDRVSIFDNSTGLLNFGNVRGFSNNAIANNGVDIGGGGTATALAHP
jgi:hypothetical protein